MANLQPTYSQYHNRAMLGMLATSRSYDATGKTNTQAAAIAFGLACIMDGEDGAKLGAPGTFAGITLHQTVLDQVGITSGSVTAEEFAQGGTMGLLRSGDIWVTTEDAVVAGDTAKWNNDGTIAKGGTNAFPGVAIFETDAAAGELVRLRLES